MQSSRSGPLRLLPCTPVSLLSWLKQGGGHGKEETGKAVGSVSRAPLLSSSSLDFDDLFCTKARISPNLWFSLEL